MSTPARRRIGTALLVLAVVLGLAQIVGMMQTPRPAWSRASAVPMLALVIIGAVLRRGTPPPP